MMMMVTMNRWSVVALSMALMVGAACGEDEVTLPNDAGTTVDVGAGDAGTTADTSLTDAGSDDAGSEDAGAADVGAADTTEPGPDVETDTSDTGAPDTGSEPTDVSDAGGSTDDVTGDCVPYEAIAPLFVSNGCTNSYCHGGPTNASGLGLEDGYASLVNVGSVGAPGEVRVIPGDPDGSYLIHKIEGTASAGNAMPPIGDVSSDDIAALRAWIAAGAAESCP